MSCVDHNMRTVVRQCLGFRGQETAATAVILRKEILRPRPQEVEGAGWGLEWPMLEVQILHSNRGSSFYFEDPNLRPFWYYSL